MRRGSEENLKRLFSAIGVHCSIRFSNFSFNGFLSGMYFYSRQEVASPTALGALGAPRRLQPADQAGRESLGCLRRHRSPRLRRRRRVSRTERSRATRVSRANWRSLDCLGPDRSGGRAGRREEGGREESESQSSFSLITSHSQTRLARSLARSRSQLVSSAPQKRKEEPKGRNRNCCEIFSPRPKNGGGFRATPLGGTSIPSSDHQCPVSVKCSRQIEM